MVTATVVGNVRATRLAEIPKGAFLEVEADGSGQRFVAFDVLGSGVGERVLVVQGSVAAAWFPGEPPPVDALISARQTYRAAQRDHDLGVVGTTLGSHHHDSQ